MVHKIIHVKGQLDYICWFEKAADGQRVTRSAADPLSLKLSHDSLELRENYFSVRAVDG